MGIIRAGIVESMKEYKHYVHGVLQEAQGFGDSAEKDILASPTPKELEEREDLLQEMVDINQAMGLYDEMEDMK